MKPFLVFTAIIFILIAAISCRNTEKSTLKYITLSYDTTKITIFQWDTTKYVFPPNADPLPLSQNDLVIADSLLRDAIDSFNIVMAPRLYLSFDKIFPVDSFTIIPTKYKAQFFPYKDVNGQRVVFIIGFNDNFERWQKEIYVPHRNHYGIKKYELKINLSDKTREDVQTGSYG